MLGTAATAPKTNKAINNFFMTFSFGHLPGKLHGCIGERPIQ